ncbi:helix-turn-helix transcriptional regulator [Gordonia sp. NPDC003376]
MSDNSERLSVKEAAVYLGVSAQTLYNLRSAGTGPASYLLSNRLKYDRRDLDLYVAQQKAASLVGGAA